MRAMILAAGRGERMRPLTDACPKPLLDVAGTPLIGWHLKRLATAGIHSVVINHAWLGNMLEERLRGGMEYGVEIAWSAEGTALETAGGIARALSLLGRDPFLVINGDIFCDYDFTCLRDVAIEMAADPMRLAHLVLVPNPDHHPMGDFVLAEDGKVAATGEGKLTFSGIGLYRPDLFLGIDPDRPAKLAPLLIAAMALGKASAERHDGLWIDVGTVDRLEQARHCAAGR
ncbi:MAG: nucleotidyltransferase family protein [Formivibrio sp.]|nr:nucleotidyltransferase family protein [Formivibrio sp.]